MFLSNFGDDDPKEMQSKELTSNPIESSKEKAGNVSKNGEGKF